VGGFDGERCMQKGRQCGFELLLRKTILFISVIMPYEYKKHRNYAVVLLSRIARKQTKKSIYIGQEIGKINK